MEPLSEVRSSKLRHSGETNALLRKFCIMQTVLSLTCLPAFQPDGICEEKAKPMIPAPFKRISLQALLLIGSLIIGQSAQAGIPASGPDYLNKAMQNFIIRLEAAKKHRLLPLISNEQDASMLENVWNLRPMIGSSPYHASDLPVLLDMIQQQAQITKTYVLFSPDPDKLPDTKSNSKSFQNEITRSSVAMLGLISAALEAAGDFAKTLEQNNQAPDTQIKTQKASLLKLRLGLQQVINGTVLMLHDPDLKPDNQQLLTQALADHSAIIATSVSVQDRQALISVIKGAEPVLNQSSRDNMQRFIEAMNSTGCTGLCALH